MPFTEEVNKVAQATNAITSNWKVWAMAAAVIAGAIIVGIVLYRLV